MFITAYLINASGQIAHSWSLPSNANYAMALKPNGNIVRGAVNPGNSLNGAAVGGKLQEFTPNGTLVWEFIYSTTQYVTHHDICLMPNGNVLMTAWAAQTNAVLQAMCANPALLASSTIEKSNSLGANTSATICRFVCGPRPMKCRSRVAQSAR